jgi:hypothetical protein
MHRVRAPVGERGPGGPRGFLARLASLGIASLGIASGAAWAQLGRSDAKRRTQRSSLHPVAPRRPPTDPNLSSCGRSHPPTSGAVSAALVAPFRPGARGGVVVVVVAHVFEQRLTRLACVLVRVCLRVRCLSVLSGAVGPRLALAAALSDVCLLLCCCRPQLPQPQRRAICGGRHGLAWTALGGLTAPTLASRWDGRSCSLCAERAQRIP